MTDPTEASSPFAMPQWKLIGRWSLSEGAIRGHFLVLCMFAGATGWAINWALIGGFGPDEVAVGLIARHLVALAAGFLMLAILTRVWLSLAGPAPMDSPTGFMSVAARLANSAIQPGEAHVTSQDIPPSALSPTGNEFVATSAKSASSEKSSGGKVALLIFLVVIVALAIGIVIVAVWAAPRLLASMVADMKHVADESRHAGAFQRRFLQGSWIFAFARHFGLRYGLLSALLLLADSVVLHVAPDALTWLQALKIIES